MYLKEEKQSTKEKQSAKENYAIIETSSEERRIDMVFFRVNWKNYVDALAKTASQEDWSNPTYPNNGILVNYITYTYNKLKSERGIMVGEDFAVFNTGLFTSYCEPIYAYQTGSDIQFLTEYELSNLGIENLPERANYFENPELLLFDWHYPINVQYKHILEDEENRQRLPEFVRQSAIAESILNCVIGSSIKMVMANYKLAIPQYYNGKIQLLLPLSFNNTDKADLALVLTKVNNHYQAHTCITLDMAYNNARLIAKPESNWLAQL